MIRKMEMGDLAAVRGMMRRFYDSPAVAILCSDEVLERNLKAAMDETSLLDGIVMVENDTIVGYGLAARAYNTEFGGECIWLEELSIEPEWQGKGIGSGVFEWLKQTYPNATRIRLEAEPDNLRAIGLYEHWGFKASPYLQMNYETGK